MSTLIGLTLPNGTIHTCDESCYNSTQPECTCICEGRNHGQGIGLAERNTIVDAAEIVVKIAQHYPCFIELRFHFHNTGIPENKTRHEVLDIIRAKPSDAPDVVNYYGETFEPINRPCTNLKRTHEHPTEAAQTHRDEPDR